MLHLKRITHWNETMTCDASGEVMFCGDFYYEDDKTGKIISAKYYQGLKEEARTNQWDQSILTRATSEKEYRETLKEAEQEYITATVLSEPVYGKPSDNRAGHIPINGK